MSMQMSTQMSRHFIVSSDKVNSVIKKENEFSLSIEAKVNEETHKIPSLFVFIRQITPGGIGLLLYFSLFDSNMEVMNQHFRIQKRSLN